MAESSDPSEWQRSASNEAAPSARRSQGTATGEQGDRRRWRSQGSRASGRGRCATMPFRRQGEHRAPQQEERTIFVQSLYYNFIFPDVAQFGRALALGARCRRFESCHPDQIRTKVMIPLVLQLSFFSFYQKCP